MGGSAGSRTNYVVRSVRRPLLVDRSAIAARPRARGPLGAVLLLTVWCLASCTDTRESETHGVVRRDSAGVFVVENSAPASRDGRWHVLPDPSLSIGAMEGDPAVQFAGIIDAGRLSDGTIVVADGRSAELRYFDRGGAPIATAGGEGEGPGEFRTIERLVVTPEDTVWVYDFALQRFTVVDAHGALVRVVPLDRPPPALGFAGRLADGTLLMGQYWGAGEAGAALPEGLRRDSAALVRFDRGGSLLDTIGRFPGREVHLALEGNRMVMGSPLFGRALSRVAAGERVWLGDQASFEIRAYEPDGSLVLIVRVIGADLSITQELLDAALDARLREVRPERRHAMRAFLREADRPAARPAYGEFLIDPEGSLWVAAYVISDGAARDWYVFSADGRWLSTVRMPVGFRLLAVGDRWLLGVARDDLDVEYVRLHPLVR